jgi:hypothetical protein
MTASKAGIVMIASLTCRLGAAALQSKQADPQAKDRPDTNADESSKACR